MSIRVGEIAGLAGWVACGSLAVATPLYVINELRVYNTPLSLEKIEPEAKTHDKDGNLVLDEQESMSLLTNGKGFSDNPTDKELENAGDILDKFVMYGYQHKPHQNIDETARNLTAAFDKLREKPLRDLTNQRTTHK